MDETDVPFYGIRYSFDGDKILGQAPLVAKNDHILVGYDLFDNVSYFLRGAESSLGMKRIKGRDLRLNPQSLQEIRGVPPSVPIVDIHAKLLLFSILLLHKREGFPLLVKRIPPADFLAGLAISFPVLSIGKPRFGIISKILGKGESWLERLAKNSDQIAFFVGRGEDYSPSGISDELRFLEESGHEVGLLASTRASIDHSVIAEEYEELANVLKRGDIGVRFRGISSTLMDAWKSAAYINASYVLTADLTSGIGFGLGISLPFKPNDLVWNIPVIARLYGREKVPNVVDFIKNKGGMVAVDVYDEYAALSLNNRAQKAGLWVTTPDRMIKRFRAVSGVRGVFRYDRKYLEGKIVSAEDVKDLSLRVINPSGRDIYLKIDLVKDKSYEVNVPV